MITLYFAEIGYFALLYFAEIGHYGVTPYVKFHL